MKRILALAVAGVMALGLTACSTPASVGKIGEVEIPSGLYLLYQMYAYDDAKSEIKAAASSSGSSGEASSSEAPSSSGESSSAASGEASSSESSSTESSSAASSSVKEVDFWKDSIDGASTQEWIANRTREKLERYAGLMTLAAQYDIQLTEEENAVVDSAMESYASNERYAKNGVGTATLRLAFEAEMKATKLLTAIYGEGGSEAVSSAELDSYIKENYTGVTGFTVPLMTANYSFATEDQQGQIESVVDAALKDLRDGKEMEEVAKSAVKQVYGIMAMEGYTDENAAPITTNIYRADAESDFGAEVAEEMFGLKEGEFASADLFTSILIYRRDAIQNPDTIRENALSNMKGEDLEDKLLETGKALDYQLSDSATKSFSPKKIKE